MDYMIFNHIIIVVLFVILPLMQNCLASSGCAVNPTKGFTRLPLSKSNFHFLKPYDLPLSSRYSYSHGIHKLWVYSTDKPFNKNSTTCPRTEIHISGYDYSTGVWQFEGYGYIPSGTRNVCVMQVFGASLRSYATTLMLVVRNNTLRYYDNPGVTANIHDRWFRLNVIHDVDSSHLKVYINRCLKLEASGHGGDFHFFKFGVYSQYDGSYYMESRWKRIKVFKK